MPGVSEALFFAGPAKGDNSKANDALDKIRGAQGQTEIVGNLEGLFKLAQIDFPGAKATFTELVQKYPDFMPAKTNLARVEILMGDHTAASHILAEVLAKQPTAEPALTMVVSDYVQTNKLAEAASVLEHAHQADPSQTHITAALGEIYI